MDNNQILMIKEKLEFFGIIKESLKLIPRNLNFIILTILASLPYLCFLLFLEINFQKTFIDAIKSKLTTIYAPPTFTGATTMFLVYVQPTPIGVVLELIKDVFLPFLLPGLLHLVIVHLLHLLSTVTVVHSSSMIYAGENTVNLKEMLCRPFTKVGLEGPLITSIYALLLTSLAFIGLVSLSTHIFLTSVVVFKAAFVLVLLALLMKYIEWSSIWKMGMVISILEEKHGDVALGVSAYISRGSRKRGFLLMLVFFVWWVALKLMCLYEMWSDQSNRLLMVSVGEVLLICLGNVVKWVVFTVYYYDCKKRFLEKKVDVEQAKATQSV